jgi:DNA replication protein DnaC
MQAAPRGHRVAFASAQPWVARLAAATRQGRSDEELERISRRRRLSSTRSAAFPSTRGRIAVLRARVEPLRTRLEYRELEQDPFGLGRDLRRPVAGAVLVDRLVHHAEVPLLRGDSYRLNGKGKEVLQVEVDG